MFKLLTGNICTSAISNIEEKWIIEYRIDFLWLLTTLNSLVCYLHLQLYFLICTYKILVAKRSIMWYWHLQICFLIWTYRNEKKRPILCKLFNDVPLITLITARASVLMLHYYKHKITVMWIVLKDFLFTNVNM